MKIENEIKTETIIDILSKLEEKQTLPFSIDELNLSTRVRHAILRSRLITIGKLVKNWRMVPKIRNMGDKGILEINDKLNLWYQQARSSFPSGLPTQIPVDQLFDDQPKIDQIIDNQPLSDNNDNFFNIPIEELDLPIRAYNVLKRNDIETVGQLLAKWQNIDSLKNVGPNTLEQIQEAIVPFQNQINAEKDIRQGSLSDTNFANTDTALLGRYYENIVKVNIRALDLHPHAKKMLWEKDIHEIDQITFAKLIEIGLGEDVNPNMIRNIHAAVLYWLSKDENRRSAYLDVMKGKGIVARPEEISFTDYFNYLFSLLGSRYLSILEYRYGLRNGNKTTLEETAKHFGVTRERIRQIESQAIDIIKAQLSNMSQPSLFNQIGKSVVNRGGLISQSRLLDELQHEFVNTGYSIDGILDFFNKIFDGEIGINYGKEKLIYVQTLSGWSASSCEEEQIIHAANKILEILMAAEHPVQWTDLFSKLITKDGLLTLDEHLAHAVALCLSDTHQIQRQLDGGWSKYEKSTRTSRIISVMRQIGQPAHFSEISDRYDELYNDQPLSEHGIHTVLSGRNEFVRVGQGKYGLPEWGLHDDGNVSNAVLRILVDHKYPMYLTDIANEVLKTWDVQNSAVISAIDGDARFSKTEDGKIWLTETGLTLKKRVKRDDDTRWDRVLIVLKELEKPSPVHFIVEAHNKSYPERPLTIPAVRGMLYRKPDLFIRTGQDEFGLAEWDIKPFQDTPINRSEEILRIFQQKSRLHVDEVHSLYNEQYPEKIVSLITIRSDLKKLSGIISTSGRGIYEIKDNANAEPSDSQHDGRFERILKIFIEMHRPSRVPPILERYNLLYPADNMSLEGFMEYLMYIKNHPEKQPALYEDKQLASS